MLPTAQRVLILLFASAVFVQSQSPSPTPGKASQEKQQEAASKEGNGEDHKTIPQPVTVTAVNAPEVPDPTKHRGNPSSTDWWMLLFTAVIAIAALVQAHIYWRQKQLMATALSETKKAADAATSAAGTASETLGHMKASGDETKTQIDRLISEQQRTANAMEGSVHSAKAAMDVSERQSKAALDASIDNSRLSLRPWVGLTDEAEAVVTTPITFDSTGNAVVSYSITVKSFGTAAAQNVTSCAFLVITQDIDSVLAEQKVTAGENYIGNPNMGFVLFGGKFWLNPQSGSMYQKHRMVSPGHNGQFQAWLVGCIGYRDQFKHLYRTNFIYRLMNPDTRVTVEFDATPNTTVNGVFVAWQTSFE